MTQAMRKPGDMHTQRFNQSTKDGACLRPILVLIDYRVDAYLKRGPRSGNPQTGPRPNERSEAKIPGQRGPSRLICVETEHASNPFHHVDHAFPVRKVGSQHQAVRVAGMQLQHTGLTVEDDRPPIDCSVHGLHTRQSPVGQEAAYCIPVVRRCHRKPETQAPIGHKAVRSTTPLPQLVGRLAECLAHCPVELA